MTKQTLLIVLISLTIFSCSQKKNKIDTLRKISFSDIEVREGIMYNQSEEEPFTGLVEYSGSKYKASFELTNGLKNGKEIHFKANGDTITYVMFENGAEVFKAGFNDKGERLYAINKITEPIDTIEYNLTALQLKDSLMNNSFSYLESLFVQDVKRLLGKDLKIANALESVYNKIGEVEDVKLSLIEVRVDPNTDSLYRFDLLLSNPKIHEKISLDIQNDSIIKFKFHAFKTEIIPVEIVKEIHDNLITENYNDIFSHLNASSQVRANIINGLKEFSILNTPPKFIHSYIDLDGSVAASYLIEYKNPLGIIEEGTLKVGVMFENNKPKLNSFWVGPYRQKIMVNAK